MMCNDCLEELKEVLRLDDIQILEILSEQNSNSPQTSLSRPKIQKFGDKLTIAKSVTSLHRLEAATLIKKVSGGKHYKYYITNNGYGVLDLLKEQMNNKRI